MMGFLMLGLYLVVSQGVESLPVVVDLRRDILILQNYPGHPTLAPLCKNKKKIKNRKQGVDRSKKKDRSADFFLGGTTGNSHPPSPSRSGFLGPVYEAISLGVEMDSDLKPDSKIKIELFPIEAAGQNKAGSSEAAL